MAFILDRDRHAQNSWHANSSNLAGQKGHWVGEGETGVLTSLDFPEYMFCNDKTLSDPPSGSAWYAFFKNDWKNCVGSHERISGSAHEKVHV